MVLLLSNSLPNDKFLGKSKFKGSADGNTNVTQKLKFILGRVENIVGKKRKYWLPAFSPFPTMFSKDFTYRAVNNWGCVVKS